MKKNININNHINEIMYRSNYKINESPKYHQVIDSTEEFDKFPNDISEADEEIPPVNAPTKEVASEPIDDPNQAAIPVDDQPNIDPNQQPTDDPNIGDPMGDPAMDTPIIPDEPNVDELQNDIIKTNLEALKHIQDKLKSLDDFVKNIDTKISVLSSDVEEVRAPSNGEKLMSQKKVSYPYYYNLNDYWDDSSFKHKSQEEDFGQGIQKLSDGTFIADFDDLPKNIGNIDKSFTDY